MPGMEDTMVNTTKCLSSQNLHSREIINNTAVGNSDKSYGRKQNQMENDGDVTKDDQRRAH